MSKKKRKSKSTLLSFVKSHKSFMNKNLNFGTWAVYFRLGEYFYTIILFECCGPILTVHSHKTCMKLETQIQSLWAILSDLDRNEFWAGTGQYRIPLYPMLGTVLSSRKLNFCTTFWPSITNSLVIILKGEVERRILTRLIQNWKMPLHKSSHWSRLFVCLQLLQTSI